MAAFVQLDERSVRMSQSVDAYRFPCKDGADCGAVVVAVHGNGCCCYCYSVAPLDILSPSCFSYDDFGTRSWSVARSTKEYARFRCVFDESDSGCSGTPFPIPKSVGACMFGGTVSLLMRPLQKAHTERDGTISKKLQFLRLKSICSY